MRQIVLDTETTGLEPSQGHKIIEIGCVELRSRRISGHDYHQYLQPDREIDQGAIEVHGITNEFLEDKPRFSDVVKDFIEYVSGAELIIHNAPFDVGFINHELALLGPEWGRIEDHCSVIDTLTMARDLHPGQRNSLDALCKRYEVDNSARELHGALLDARILADVYLVMTGGQASLVLGEDSGEQQEEGVESLGRVNIQRESLVVIRATDEELGLHGQRLAAIDKASDGNCRWKQASEA
jgi:DNA polymerase-3 subunit epsilon